MIDISTIVAKKVTPLDAALEARNNLFKRRTTQSGPKIVLVDGPLAGHDCQLTYYERYVTFTDASGAYQYVRLRCNKYVVQYAYLTPEMQEELAFEQDLAKLSASLESADVTFRWCIPPPAWRSYGLNDQLRPLGFRWSVECREYYLIGSRNAYAKELRIAEAIPGVKLICEPVFNMEM